MSDDDCNPILASIYQNRRWQVTGMMIEQFMLDPKQQPHIASYGQVTKVFERNSIPFVINWITSFY